MSDSLIKINCESCGAELAIQKEDASVKCGFCNTLNKLSFDNEESALSPSKNLLLNSIQSENWEEALKYCTKILEKDPSDYEAWFYKGLSTGFLSRHIDHPDKEITNCFKNAFANAGNEDTAKVMSLLDDRGTELLVTLTFSSMDFMKEHGFLGSANGGYDNDLIAEQSIKILGLIDCAYFLTEINRHERLKNLSPCIDYSFLNIYGSLFRKINFDGMHHTSFESPFDEEKLNIFGMKVFYKSGSGPDIQWNERVEEILNIYKTGGYDLGNLSEDDKALVFKDPRISETKGGGCFVATAVYGTEDHFDLIVLRSFRDNFLSDYNLGKKFIAFYYKYGPNFARKVSKSIILKGVFSPLVNLGVIIVRYLKIG